MKVAMTGTIDGKDWPAVGGDIEVADHVAQDMILNGYADKADKPAKAPKVEAAAVDPVEETATVKPARARKTAKD